MTTAAMSKSRTDASQTPGKQPKASKRTWSDESLAPEVDHELLKSLVRQELPEKKARAVYQLIHSFKSWDAAHAKTLIAEHRGKQGGRKA